MATIFTRRLQAIGSQFISKNLAVSKVQMSGSCHKENKKERKEKKRNSSCLNGHICI